MNCGAPQNLAACPQCGALNQKSAANCQKCAVPLSVSVLTEPAMATSPAVSGHAQQAEALAKEAQKFKQLFDELEQDAKRHPRQGHGDPKLALFLPTAPVAAAAPAGADFNVVHGTSGSALSPSQPALAQSNQRRGKRDRRRLAGLALFIVLSGLAYYTVVGHDATVATLRSLTTLQARKGAESSGQIPPSPAIPPANSPASP